MTPPHTIMLLGIGVPIEVTIHGESSEEALIAAESAWDVLRAPAGTEAHRALSFTVEGPEAIPGFLDRLSTQVTLEGIEERSGESLLLHAAGLADPRTGITLACVAPSGTGKTTLSTAAAGRFHYVTDETVAVRPDGSIDRYPKPLSVKQHVEGWAPKHQRPPAELGLTPAADGGLALGGIVLLDRVRDAEAAEAARFTPVPLFDAIIALVPELSYLSRMARPLHRVAEAVLSTGGALRLRYSEATDAIRLLADQHPALQRTPSASDSSTGAAHWAAASAETLRPSDDEIEYWQQQLTAVRRLDTPPASPRHRSAAPLDDILVDLDAGSALVFSANTVSLVSPIAAAILFASRDSIAESELRRYLIGLFGEPPITDPGTDPIAATIDALHERGHLIAE